MDRTCVLDLHGGVKFTDWFIGARAYSRDDGMICNGLDYSYLGVHGLWQHDLGKNYGGFIHRTITELAALKVLIPKLGSPKRIPKRVRTSLRRSRNWFRSLNCPISRHKAQIPISLNSVNSASSVVAHPSLPPSSRRRPRAWCVEANGPRRPRWQSFMATQDLLVVRC